MKNSKPKSKTKTKVTRKTRKTRKSPPRNAKKPPESEGRGKSLQFPSANETALAAPPPPRNLSAEEVIQRMCNCAAQMGVTIDCPINACPREAKYLELRLATALPASEVKKRAREWK